MARQGGETKRSHSENTFDIEKYHALEMALDDDDTITNKMVNKSGMYSNKMSKHSDSYKRSQSMSSSTNISLYSDNTSKSSSSHVINNRAQPSTTPSDNLIPSKNDRVTRIVTDDLYGLPNNTEKIDTDYVGIDEDIQIYDHYPKLEQETPDQSLTPDSTDIYLLEDESIGMYCLDIQEDSKGNLYIFGKVITSPYTADGVNTSSCCIIVTECMRDLYFKVRMDLEFKIDNSETVINSQNSLYQKMIMKGFYNELQTIKSHYVWRKIVQNGPCSQQMFIKVCYPYSSPEIRPEHYSGIHYSEIYGLNSSLVERFAVKRKIKGPCWIKIKEAKLIKDNISRCQFEFTAKTHKSVIKWNYKDQESKIPEPPLPTFCICSISLKMITVNNIPEAFQVSMIYNKSARIDNPLFDHKNASQFICVRKIPNKHWPNGLEKFCKSRPYICLVENERGMIALFFNKLQQIDPDILVSHDIENNVIENLTKRAIATGLPQRISFSRFKFYKKGQINTQGRLVCDSRILQKEFNPRQVSYDLEFLVKFDKWKPDEKFSRTTFALEEIDSIFMNLGKLLEFIQSSSKFAYYSLEAIIKIQALPLTRELTCVAGNLWAHSLACMRSDRNDMLLLHEFHRLKYVISSDFQKTKDIKKGSYEGGLVLDPVLGLYDTFVLLLDFNALYPSIIQEFNVCFTTAVISPTLDHNNNIQVERILSEPGVLPNILKRLVESSMLTEKNLQKKSQLNVKQLALKLIANSLYGCLGSPYSRFHAQHLAAFITLQDTKERMENEFKMQVIYGDTDSLMLNTNIRHDGRIDSYNKAHQLATLLSSSVNKKYRKLEIELDGIFARLLLLKKKKYAALKVIDYANRQLEIESKGLDFIRRDWSMLTKEVGDKILNILFTSNFGDNGTDDAIEKIHELLIHLCNQMDSGKIPIDSYSITKQLNRNPEEYSDSTSLPHVSVALRINKQKKRIIRAGHEISYVICSKDSIEKVIGKCDSINLLSQRAFALEEVKELGLLPDLEYYKSVQILPPVIRLCGNIEGTNSQRLGRCLGLAVSESYERKDYDAQNSILAESSALNLIKRSIEDYRGLKLSIGLHCHKCDNIIDPETFLQYFKCNQCKSWLPINLIKNWLQRVIFELDTNSAICTRRCTACETNTQRVMIGSINQCPQMSCQSQDTMEQFLPPNKTFLYYDYIEYLLSGPLKDGPEDESLDKPRLVTVILDPSARVHPLNDTPVGNFEISDYNELLVNLSRDQSIITSSGLRRMCPIIMSLINNATCLKLHVLDYNKERKNLRSFVQNHQSRNGYSQISLNLLFSPFSTLRKEGRYEIYKPG